MLDFALFPKGVPANVKAARQTPEHKAQARQYYESLDAYGKRIAKEHGIELHDDHDEPCE